MGGHGRSIRLSPVSCLASILLLAGCDGFFDVDNITFVDASELDPASDVTTLSLSARQSFASVYDDLITFSAWFAGEAVTAETVPDRVHFARRDVSPANTQIDPLWSSLSAARVAAQDAQRLAASRADPATSADRARGALFVGWAFLFMGEMFCEATVDGGPPLSPVMALDSASVWFTLADEAARMAAAAGGTGAAEARQLASAALVGRARAHLQAGRRSEAALDAGAVPAGFSYSLLYSNDLGSRGRTGNTVWGLTGGARNVLGVAPAFRVLDDHRMPILPPSPARPPLDGTTEYWTQAKYKAFDAPIRLASSLEAAYLLAEASGPTVMLQLIQARRASAGQPPYDGRGDEISALAELMTQRSREFYLEGKAMGDSRRHPGAVSYQPVPGAPFPKPGYAPIGSQSCWPLPLTETQNNPHFR